jgi:uncharacterized SAM-binding protein YcdF (DUF218 family)
MDTRVKPAYDSESEVRRSVHSKQRPFKREFPLFFVLSKTLGHMMLPTNFLIGIGLAGLILLATRFVSLGRKLAIFALVLLAICAYSPLGNVLLYPLEARFPSWDAARGAPDGIIVLGGSIEADISAAHGTAVVRGAPDRIIGAAALALRYPNARVVFSGGSPNLISNDAREADYAGAIFESLGIAKSRLIMERGSRNTLENAEFSKALLAPKEGERWLLVTSAYHMPRSVGLFRKAGFSVEPYPVDWRVGGRGDLFAFTDVAVDGLGRTDLAVREWMGLIAYRATGKIDDLLPGPALK